MSLVSFPVCFTFRVSFTIVVLFIPDLAPSCVFSFFLNNGADKFGDDDMVTAFNVSVRVGALMFLLRIASAVMGATQFSLMLVSVVFLASSSSRSCF